LDSLVRERLVARGVELIERRKGRPRVEEAWLRSLTAADPWLARSLPLDQLRALEAELTRWIASGAATTGRTRLCLRVREPAEDDDANDWAVELLAQDAAEPSLVVPAALVWDGRAPFGDHAFEELLAGLGRVARLAPELAPLLDE